MTFSKGYLPWNKGKHIHSEKWKSELSKRMCGKNNPFYGKKHSEQSLLKMSEFQKTNNHQYWKGKTFTEDHKKKLSEARLKGLAIGKIKTWNIGVPCSKKTKVKLHILNKGKKLSKEQRNKMSNSHLGKKYKPMSEQGKKNLSDSLKGNKKLSELMKLRRKTIILPLKDTSIELKIQRCLVDSGILFEKHKAIFGQPDIFLAFPKVAIFADGDYWHKYPLGRDHDRKVNSVLTEQGYTVLRFWEHEINNDIKGCIQQIQSVILWNSLEMVS